MATARRRRFVVLAAVIAACAVAATALAYWTATGSGAGSGTTANPGAQTITVNQTSASSGLYPGGSVPLSGDFDNPAANSVHINSISATVTGTDQPGCNASDYSVSGTPAISGGGDIPSGSGVGSWSGLTLSMANTGANQDACKGATVTLSYSAS